MKTDLNSTLARLKKPEEVTSLGWLDAMGLHVQWSPNDRQPNRFAAALLDLIQRQDDHTTELESERDALKAKLGKRIQIMDHVWRCGVCGDLADPISVDWKWVKDRWEHSHGEPIGRCAAQNLGPWHTLLLASIAREKRLLGYATHWPNCVITMFGSQEIHEKPLTCTCGLDALPKEELMTTPEMIWNAEVRFAVSPQWNTLGSAIERAIESALTLARVVESLSVDLDEPEPTNDEWTLAWKQVQAWRSSEIINAGQDFCNRVTAEAYRLAAERAKVKP